MRVLVAPDSFGGTLAPSEAAAAIADGWRSARPDDQVVVQPLSDGGEGLLDVARTLPGAVVHEVDVAGPLALARTARWVLLGDGTAIVETAEACGLRHVPPGSRDPRRATMWGVGQLLVAARERGAARVLVGLGGSATVDGGAGALHALGHRLRVTDGSGLKVGGEDLPRVRAADRARVADWSGTTVELLCDVTTPLGDAAEVFGPQKGADAATVAHLARGLEAWRRVCERDLGADPALARRAGTGAAGGLAYGLLAAFPDAAVATGPDGAPSGAHGVASLVDLEVLLDRVDVVVTGEGRLDATSAAGKVVGMLRAATRDRGLPLLATVGQVGADVPEGLVDAVEAAEDEDDAARAVAAAAGRLAAGR